MTDTPPPPSTPSSLGPPALPEPFQPEFSPVPRERQRCDGWTPERQHDFIAALADLGSVKAAAIHVGMTSESAYMLRRHPEAKSFRKAWEAALAHGVTRLEDLALERAIHGIEVPVYSYGKLVGTRVVYNDRLLMFILRNRAPTRFSGDGRVAARRSAIADPAEANRLSRLKKQWRKEWEEERAKGSGKSSEQIIQDINRKLERRRQNWLAGMSPETRTLHDAYEAANRADEARREAERAKPYTPRATPALEAPPPPPDDPAQAPGPSIRPL